MKVITTRNKKIVSPEEHKAAGYSLESKILKRHKQTKEAISTKTKHWQDIQARRRQCSPAKPIGSAREKQWDHHRFAGENRRTAWGKLRHAGR